MLEAQQISKPGETDIKQDVIMKKIIVMIYMFINILGIMEDGIIGIW